MCVKNKYLNTYPPGLLPNFCVMHSTPIAWASSTSCEKSKILSIPSNLCLAGSGYIFPSYSRFQHNKSIHLTLILKIRYYPYNDENLFLWRLSDSGFILNSFHIIFNIINSNEKIFHHGLPAGHWRWQPEQNWSGWKPVVTCVLR